MSRRRSKPKKDKPVSKRAKDGAIRRIRSVLGSSILNAGRERYGEKKIDDIAKVLARDLSKKKQAEIRKERKRREGIPLSRLDQNRYKVLKEINYRRGPEVRFFRRKDGNYDKWKDGKVVGKASPKQKRAYETSRPYQKLIRIVKSTFDIEHKQARKLVKDVADQSRRKLKRFKKTKKYKRMSKRRKRRYSESRTRVNALMRLGFILTGRYDSVGFRLAEAGEDEDDD